MKGADHEVFYVTSILAGIGAAIAIIWIKPAKDAKNVKRNQNSFVRELHDVFSNMQFLSFIGINNLF